MAKSYRCYSNNIKSVSLKNVHTITDLPTKRVLALSRHCHTMYRLNAQAVTFSFRYAAAGHAEKFDFQPSALYIIVKSCRRAL